MHEQNKLLRRYSIACHYQNTVRTYCRRDSVLEVRINGADKPGVLIEVNYLGGRKF